VPDPTSVIVGNVPSGGSFFTKNSVPKLENKGFLDVHAKSHFLIIIIDLVLSLRP